MTRILVIQLARLGDLLQTKRLVMSLAQYGVHGEPAKVHLLVDASLAAFAGRVYPFAEVHALPAHAGGLDPLDVPGLCRRALDALSDFTFERVFNINLSPLSLALSAGFDPDSVRGHRLDRGQARRDARASVPMRFTRKRSVSPVNLMDYWAGFAPMRVSPVTVSPQASSKGGGIGLAVAGRHARRSPPPQVMAKAAAVFAAKHDFSRLTLFGTAAESSSARAIFKNLPAALAEKTRDLTGKTGLAELEDEVASLDMLITPDTGLMHLAAHAGAPVTALFLSSAWCHETGPYGLGHTVWQAVPGCAPCLESAPCPHGLACLDPFSGPDFARALGTGGRGPVPEGLVGYESGFDDLGVVFAPFAGSDVRAADRAGLRRLAGRLYGEASFFDLACDPGAAGDLYIETDYLLPGRDRSPGRTV